MADQPPRLRMWILFGLLWGVIALTNTAILSMFPFCLLWLLYRLPRKTGQLVGAALCVLTAALVVSPWLVRNYEVFGKFIFVRDNLPLEMYEANNDQSVGTVDPKRTSRKQSRSHAEVSGIRRTRIHGRKKTSRSASLYVSIPADFCDSRPNEQFISGSLRPRQRSSQDTI